MKYLRFLAVPAMLALTAGAAQATPNVLHRMHNAMAKAHLNINMAAENGSKENGTAAVTDLGNNRVMVKVAVFREPKGASQMAHIHAGACPNVKATPWKALKNVVNGTSITTLSGVSVAQIKAGKYAINVHDAKNPKRYVSCGNL